MSGERPRLNQLNLVVEDMDAAVAFYQRLGMTVRFDSGEWPPGSGARHVALDNGDGPIFELDNLAMARIWHGGWRERERSGAKSNVVINFSLTSRQEVDELYAALTTAGHVSRQAPYDAFWGCRYAIVTDPDGNDCGLMSPEDPARKYEPDGPTARAQHLPQHHQ
jgi:catechol 2,3-dioxygenase-like lactoylglutathione lyase family enzyme